MMSSMCAATSLGNGSQLGDRRVLVTGGSGFIGTNFVELLLAAGAEVCNVDIAPPNLAAHRRLWTNCDIMDPSGLCDVVGHFRPTDVVHLAARADSDGDSLDGYRMNSDGSRNVTDALAATDSIRRYVLISTQFVLGPAIPFEHERHYAPHTVYGQSKVLAEEFLREDDPPVTWTIARPTNVWGPWHRRYQRQFWRVLQRGLYLHPLSPDPIRSFGYVGSVCLQILGILCADHDAVHGRALYVGDQPIPQSLWVDEFSTVLRGDRARRAPASVLRAMGRLGDLAQRLHLPTPLSSSRYASMVTPYPTPMERTADALGSLPAIPLALGVRETARWLDDGTTPDASQWLDAATPDQEPTSGHKKRT